MQRQNSVRDSSFKKVIHKDTMYACSYNMNVVFVLNLAEKLNLEMMWKSTKSSQKSFIINIFIH